MHFTTALLALAASAASASASDMGAWNVTLTKSSFANGYSSQSLNAIYVSDSYPSPGIITNCKSEHNPAADPVDSSSCEPVANGFSYEFDGATIKVQQNVEKPNPMTVFGNAPLELKADGAAGRSFKGNAIFDVTSAIA